MKQQLTIRRKNEIIKQQDDLERTNRADTDVNHSIIQMPVEI